MRLIEFWVTNNTADSIAFYLEPWGGQYTVLGHRSLRVVITSPSDLVLEWEVADGYRSLIVRDPAGASASVYDGATEVLAQ